jgi:acetoin utilization protein AcuC
MGIGTADCPIFPDLYSYASLAAGGTLTAVNLILQNKAEILFNPSGGFHHAFPQKAGGFCYINDVVLGALALRKAGLKVFCLDLDAHHGDGTQHAFYHDNDVFTVSLHESGETLFPFGGFVYETGEGAGKGFNVNMPLPAGTDDEAYFFAFQNIAPPQLAAYKPDVIILEIGMDILSVDPLTHLNLTNNILSDILPALMDTKLPLLLLGGGGYNLEATARGWALAWATLCHIEPDNDMWMGMGGVFLGSSEWSAGLRDMHVYTTGAEKTKILKQINQTLDYIKKNIFPIHHI